MDWHWHATLEINICASGVLKTSTQRGEYIVREGDGVLVNANVLHRNEAFEGARGVRVQTHMFDRSLVAAAELPLRRYVAPVVECTLLDALPLFRENAEHRAVLEALDRAFAAAGEEKTGYELEICGLLNRVWQGVYALALPVIGARQPLPRPETARLKRMLGFIRDHFAEDISPADIAASRRASASASASAASSRSWAPRRLPPSRTFACARPPSFCARRIVPSPTSPPPAALPLPATSARSFAAA